MAGERAGGSRRGPERCNQLDPARLAHATLGTALPSALFRPTSRGRMLKGSSIVTPVGGWFGGGQKEQRQNTGVSRGAGTPCALVRLRRSGGSSGSQGGTIVAERSCPSATALLKEAPPLTNLLNAQQEEAEDDGAHDRDPAAPRGERERGGARRQMEGRARSDGRVASRAGRGLGTGRQGHGTAQARGHSMQRAQHSAGAAGTACTAQAQHAQRTHCW